MLTKGVYISLVNRANSRIVFSAATDEVTEESFDVLWNAIGKTIRKKMTHGTNVDYYELRIEPICGED